MAETDFKLLSREMAGRDGVGGSAIMFTILTLIVLAFLWARWAELDNVTRGEGRIISSVQNQTVQASEGGVILRRYVDENTIVEAGEILFEIDPVDANSELNRLEKRLRNFGIRDSRLRAEIKGEEFLSADFEAFSPAITLAERSLFVARKLELAGQLEVLSQRLEQKRQDLKSAKNNVSTAESIALLLGKEITVVEPLVRENISPATTLLELQRQLQRVLGDQERGKVAIDQALSSIVELETEIQNARDNYRLRAMDERNGIVAEQSELTVALPRLRERVSRTKIRSPMEGVVSRLNFRTAGGFVKTGDIILELVPTGEALIIESKIMPQDISRIRVDDEVQIRLSAYDSSKYGSVDGSVLRVSPDAIVDERNPGLSYYLVHVSIDGELRLEETGEVVKFLPGMTATVDVLSGKRSVLEYIWQPIAKVKELALRD